MTANSAPAHVDVQLNYLAKGGHRPVNYAITPPPGVPQRSGEVVAKRVRLRLGRIGHAEPGLREPAQRVHNDQTFFSGPRRVRDHLPADEAEQRLTERHAIINVWRGVECPVLTWPLAMCDARTIDPGDLIPSDLVYADKVGEASKSVRWCFGIERARLASTKKETS
jgi:hypothetical protein